MSKISPELFSNVIYSNGTFAAHTNGYIYQFDNDQQIIKQLEGNIFSYNTPFQEPVIGKQGCFVLGHNKFNQYFIFKLEIDKSVPICQVSEQSILAKLDGNLYIFISQKVFILEDNQLLFIKSLDINITQIYTDSESFFIFDSNDNQIYKMDKEFRILNKGEFIADKSYRIDQILLDQDFKSPINLDTFQKLKSDQIEREDIRQHLIYKNQEYKQFDKVQFYKQMLDQKQSKTEIQKKLQEMQNNNVFERQSYIQFTQEFLKMNPNIPSSYDTDNYKCVKIPFKISIGQRVELNLFRFRFYLQNQFYGIYDQNFVGLNKLGQIESIKELSSNLYPYEFLTFNQKVYYILKFKIYDQNNKFVISLPFEDCFFTFQVINNNLFILVQQDQVFMYMLDGQQFVRLQVFNEIVEFSASYYFNKQLFVIGKDENEDNVMFIYGIKGNQFFKSDDMLLEQIGKLDDCYGILVDIQNNRLMDLESRVFYKREGNNIVNYRKSFYYFGISLSEQFLNEFGGFNVEFWQVKMNNLFQRNEMSK